MLTSKYSSNYKLSLLVVCGEALLNYKLYADLYWQKILKSLFELE